MLPHVNEDTLAAIANEHGTPVFVYDGDAMRERALALTSALGPRTDVYYSIKANPNTAIVALMLAQGLGAEVASLGELAAATHAGVVPECIIFAGPGKADDELRRAVELGIHQINAESLHEIERIGRLAAERGTTQRVGVRVSLEADGSGAIQTSGAGTKFGFPPQQALPAVRAIVDHPNLAFGGIHAMLASQVLRVDAMLAHAARAVALAATIELDHGVPIPTLNLGGGLGVTHKADNAVFDLDAFAAGLAACFERVRDEGALKDCRPAIEPGRLLTSEFGVYIARVLDVKDTGSHRAAVLDGGIHHALLPITANTYEMTVLGGGGGDDASASTLVGGPLCTSADQWVPTAEGLRAKPGDLVAMRNCGAYGLTAGMTMFLSRGTPAEMLVLAGEHHLIRERSRPEDVLARQRIPQQIRGADAAGAQ